MTPLWHYLPIQEHGLSFSLLYLFKCLLLNFQRFSREQDKCHFQQSARDFITRVLLPPPSDSWLAFPQPTGCCESAEDRKQTNSTGDRTARQLHPSGRTRDGRLCHVWSTTHTRRGSKTHISQDQTLSLGDPSSYPLRTVKELQGILEASLSTLGHPGNPAHPWFLQSYSLPLSL